MNIMCLYLYFDLNSQDIELQVHVDPQYKIEMDKTNLEQYVPILLE